MSEQCMHENRTPSWEYSTCDDCGAVRTGYMGWKLARNLWFKSLDEARFYDKNGRLPDPPPPQPRERRTPAAQDAAQGREVVAWTDERGLERLRQGKQELVTGTKLPSDTIPILVATKTTNSGDIGRKLVGDNWTPTTENINALPRPLREYIHRLEANTDPGGNVQKAAVLEEQLRALQKLIEEGPR